MPRCCLLRCMAVLGAGLTLAGDVTLASPSCSGTGGRGTERGFCDSTAGVGLPGGIAARGCRLIRGAGRARNLCLRGAGSVLDSEGARGGEPSEGAEEQRSGEAGDGQEDVSESEKSSSADSSDPDVMSRGAFRFVKGYHASPLARGMRLARRQVSVQALLTPPPRDAGWSTCRLTQTRWAGTPSIMTTAGST